MFARDEVFDNGNYWMIVGMMWGCDLRYLLLDLKPYFIKDSEKSLDS